MPLAIIAAIAAVVAVLAAVAGAIVQHQAAAAAAKQARDIRDKRIEEVRLKQEAAAIAAFTEQQAALRQTAGQIAEARIRGQEERGFVQARSIGGGGRITARLIAEAQGTEQRLVDAQLTELQSRNIAVAQDIDLNASLADKQIELLNAQDIRKPSTGALVLNILGGAILAGTAAYGSGSVGAAPKSLGTGPSSSFTGTTGASIGGSNANLGLNVSSDPRLGGTGSSGP
jgi:hypothetical protein